MNKLAIVSTLYKSEKTIESFVNRSIKIATKHFGQDFEIILVDDGSPDKSFQLTYDIAKNKKQLKLIQLQRNYGQHFALLEGFKASNSELVFTLDSDLEEQPECLSNFLDEMNKNPEVAVISGVQQNRKGKLIEKWSGSLFYAIAKLIFGYSPAANQSAMFLMRNRVVTAVNSLSNAELTLIGAINFLGFKTNYLTIKKESSSKTAYSLNAKLALAFRILSAHIQRPIKVIAFLSLALAFGGLTLMGWTIFSYFTNNSAPEGWLSLIFLTTFLFSFLSILQSITLLLLSEILNHQRGLNKVFRSKEVNLD